MHAKTDAELFALFDALGVAHETVRHAPVFTVDEGRDMKAEMAGAHTKNLFLKDKKGALFLVCARDTSVIDLNALSKALGAARFSFGNAELMAEKLGVTPGSVTIFALMNDPDQQVRLILDEALLGGERVHFHPLRNDATTAVSRADLLKVLAHWGRSPVRVKFGMDGAPELIDPAQPLPT